MTGREHTVGIKVNFTLFDHLSLKGSIGGWGGEVAGFALSTNDLIFT
jgi:hypothetical protein